VLTPVSVFVSGYRSLLMAVVVFVSAPVFLPVPVRCSCGCACFSSCDCFSSCFCACCLPLVSHTLSVPVPMAGTVPFLLLAVLTPGPVFLLVAVFVPVLAPVLVTVPVPVPVHLPVPDYYWARVSSFSRVLCYCACVCSCAC